MTIPLVQVNVDALSWSCFVVMPFSPIFQLQYERVIRPAVEESSLTCVRGDEIYSKPRIVDDIWKSIRECRLVIAELTTRNPNVLYEVGLAHAIGKQVVIITRDETDVPFDLKALRYIYYDVQNPFWGDDLKAQLKAMIQSMLNEQQRKIYLEGISILQDFLLDTPGSTLVIDAAKTAVPIRDVSGLWHAAGAIAARAFPSVTRVLNINQSGTLLNAIELSTFFTEGDTSPSIVQQHLTGTIDGDRVVLAGTSYTYVQCQEHFSFILDSFDLILAQDGHTLSGPGSDEAQSAYQTLNFRKAQERTASPNPMPYEIGSR